MTALIVVCSWISIPIGGIPITMQAFAVFTAVGLIGGKNGVISVIIYVMLGMFGLPVFSNFSGGISVLTGPTGGYIIGFVFSALFMYFIENVFGRSINVFTVSVISGLIICYLFGTVWFMIFYSYDEWYVRLPTVLKTCVLPFIIPDLLKSALAIMITKRVRKYVRC